MPARGKCSAEASSSLSLAHVVFPPVVPVHPSSRCALTCVISGSIQALCPAPHCEIAAGCHGSGIAPLWLFSRRGSLSYVCMLCSRHLKIDSNGYRRRGRLQAPAEYVPDPPCICKCRVISSVKPKAVPVLLFSPLPVGHTDSDLLHNIRGLGFDRGHGRNASAVDEFKILLSSSLSAGACRRPIACLPFHLESLRASGPSSWLPGSQVEPEECLSVPLNSPAAGLVLREGYLSGNPSHGAPLEGRSRVVQRAKRAKLASGEKGAAGERPGGLG